MRLQREWANMRKFWFCAQMSHRLQLFVCFMGKKKRNKESMDTRWWRKTYNLCFHNFPSSVIRRSENCSTSVLTNSAMIYDSFFLLPLCSSFRSELFPSLACPWFMINYVLTMFMMTCNMKHIILDVLTVVCYMLHMVNGEQWGMS